MLEAENDALKKLYRQADAVRCHWMGDDVFIRGILEFSNICANDCLYCGLRHSNRKVRRYAMTAEAIMEVARQMAGTYQTTIVMQSGEGQGLNDATLGAIIRRIKAETNLAVTLSAGNRPRETYQYWRDCGMDRYLLRFETSDADLFRRMHPDCTLAERLGCLRILRTTGVQVGSGFMIGLPGETRDTLANNILLCRDLNLDMIGIGPFIPHPDTPLAHEKNAYADNDEIFFKALAVLRIFNPRAHIPATTAYDAVFPGYGRNLALQRGANIFMPNSSPAQYRKDYLIYPGKPCIDESPGRCAACVVARIHGLGRHVGQGPGHARGWEVRPHANGFKPE